MVLRMAIVAVATAASLVWAERPQSSTNSSDQPAASSRPSHSWIRFGGFYVGAGYSQFFGAYPYFGSYDPLLLPPIYAPGFFTGYPYGPTLGAVRIQRPDKDTWVFLDGALAGRADKLKEMWLDPGVYNLELRRDGRSLAQKIYVLSGKTLKVTPELMEARP